MEGKAAVISGLMIIAILTVCYGILSWIFSFLNRLSMPWEAYVIVAGLLLLVFTILAARMFQKE